MNSAIIFQPTQWISEIHEGSRSFEEMSELIANKEAVDQHLDLISTGPMGIPDSDNDRVLYKETRIADLPAQEAEDMRMRIRYSITSAASVYRRQMIVAVITLIESMMVDYAQAIFASFPVRMHEFLCESEKTPKGTVDLQEIIGAKTKKALISNLAKRASVTLMRGKFTSGLKAIERISKLKIDEDLFKQLTDLAEIRNRIVHERIKDEISREEVAAAFNIASKLLEFMESSARSNGLQVDGIFEFNE